MSEERCIRDEVCGAGRPLRAWPLTIPPSCTPPSLWPPGNYYAPAREIPFYEVDPLDMLVKCKPPAIASRQPHQPFLPLQARRRILEACHAVNDFDLRLRWGHLRLFGLVPGPGPITRYGVYSPVPTPFGSEYDEEDDEVQTTRILMQDVD